MIRHALFMAAVLIAGCCLAENTAGIPEFRIDSLSKDLRVRCKQFREGQRDSSSTSAVGEVLGLCLPPGPGTRPNEIRELRQKMSRAQFVELFGEPTHSKGGREKTMETLYYEYAERKHHTSVRTCVTIRDGIVVGCGDVVFSD